MPIQDLAERFPLEKAALDVHLFSIAGTPVTIATLVVFVVVLVATYVISRVVQRTLARVMSRRGIRDEGTIAVTNQLLHYSTLALGFAVGLGLAFQNLAENFVSGIILLFERSVTSGDIVCIDGLTVRVKELGLRATVVRSINDEDLIVSRTRS